MSEILKKARKQIFSSILSHFSPTELSIIFDNLQSHPSFEGKQDHSYHFVTSIGKVWQSQCNDVVNYIYDHGIIEVVLTELQMARPNNSVFAKLIESVEFDLFGSSSQALALQKYIRQGEFQDPYIFVSKILRATRQTCLLVGKHGKLGTGFLVSDDHILTNYHVYQNALEQGEQLSDIKAVFGYAKASDGRTVNPGFEIHIDDGFLPITSPVSAGELFDENPEHLDYTYLRLSENIGASQISQTLGVSEARGYFPMSVDETVLQDEEDVFVFHHPKGEPVKCSPGQFEAYEDGQIRSRVRYDAPTLFGSSGGAVLNGNFDLVALHHAGDGADPPKFNQGIPIHLIKKDIDRQLANGRDS